MVLVSPDLWVPTGVYDTISNDFVRDGLPATMADRRHHTLILIARLHPGATMASVAPALEAAGVALEQAFPGENKDQALTMAPLARMSVSTSPQTDSELGVLAMLLFSMSGLVLLVASLNLANMLLARGSSRRKEFAIRLALGGSRLRVVRQLLTESLALSLVGGVLATFVAWWATRLVAHVAREPPAGHHSARRDARRPRARSRPCCSASRARVLFGLGPAWRQARTDAVPELKEQAGEMRGRRSAAGLLARFRLPTRDLLVMGQLALSLVTLTAAGLFVRAALESATADPGFPLDRGIVANVDPEPRRPQHRPDAAVLRTDAGAAARRCQGCSRRASRRSSRSASSRKPRKSSARARRSGATRADRSRCRSAATPPATRRFPGSWRASRPASAPTISRRSASRSRAAASSCRTRNSRRPGRDSRSSTRRWRASSSAPRTRSGSSSSSRNGSYRIRSCSRSSASSPPSHHQLLEHEMRPHMLPALRTGVPLRDVSARAHRRARPPTPRRRCCRPSGANCATSIRPCRSCRSKRCRCSATATSSCGRCAPARTCS